MSAVQRIARDPVQRRQTTAGAEQKDVLLRAAGKVEAVAEGFGDRYDRSGFQLLENPSADQSAGKPAHMQYQIVVERGDARERVVARGPGILEQAQKLPGTILERMRRP